MSSNDLNFNTYNEKTVFEWILCIFYRICYLFVEECDHKGGHNNDGQYHSYNNDDLNPRNMALPRLRVIPSVAIIFALIVCQSIHILFGLFLKRTVSFVIALLFSLWYQTFGHIKSGATNSQVWWRLFQRFALTLRQIRHQNESTPDVITDIFEDMTNTSGSDRLGSPFTDRMVFKVNIVKTVNKRHHIFDDKSRQNL